MCDFNFVNFGCPEFIENALSEPSKEIGKTLSNIFSIVFSPINYKAEKLKIKHNENLKKYKLDIQQELSKIPVEKLVEPRLNIVGPALDASKFYIDDKEFRKMFAKLIAASMNSDTLSHTHCSFVEIIKQISPFDALILKELSEKYSHAIITYRLIEKGSFPPIGSNVIDNLLKLQCLNENTLDFFNASLDNLCRLNLISISYDQPLRDNKSYNEIIDFFEKDIKPKAEKYFFKKDKFKNRTFKPVFGILDITKFGQDFISICID